MPNLILILLSLAVDLKSVKNAKSCVSFCSSFTDTLTMKITVVVALLAALSVLCVASAQFSDRSESELFSKLYCLGEFINKTNVILIIITNTDEFQLFTKTYNKQYKTAEEAQLRYTNFKVFISINNFIAIFKC